MVYAYAELLVAAFSTERIALRCTPAAEPLALAVASSAWRRGIDISLLMRPSWAVPLPFEAESTLTIVAPVSLDELRDLTPGEIAVWPTPLLAQLHGCGTAELARRVAALVGAGERGSIAALLDVLPANPAPAVDIDSLPFDDSYARVVVEHSLAISANDSALIEGPPVTEAFLRAVARRIVEAGGTALVSVVPDAWNELRTGELHEARLADPDPARAEWSARCDARLAMLAPANVAALAHLDPQRITEGARGRSRVSRITLDRASRGDGRWLAAQYPTAALAANAGMGEAAYRAFFVRALRLDSPDPAAAWQAVAARQAPLVALLSERSELRFIGPGTDLTVSVAGRVWRSSFGQRNLPDGEVFTAPHELLTQGTITFGLEAAWGGGRVQGATLRFVDGICVVASAERGGDLLQAALATDQGARRLGEIAFGLNRGIERGSCDTLMDEKIGGTIHAALGRAYPECGGTNVSDIHWDLVCDLRAGGEVYADGELIQRNGVFEPHLGLEL